ncbi:MAG: DUF5685 family protein [Oscillospiraceae bacterium]
MFGYIVPCRPELRVKELAAYNATYCSLCDALSSFSLPCRMLLNYDFVFCAMICSSVCNEEPQFCDGRCKLNPLKKQRKSKPSAHLKKSAAALIISSKYKLRDDLRDEGFFTKLKSAAAMLLAHRGIKKASSLLPHLDAEIGRLMDEQCALEKTGCKSIDAAASATAQGLSLLFSDLCGNDAVSSRLGKLGYLCGRYVYLADAAEDLYDDIKKHRFNIYANLFEISDIGQKSKLSPAIEEAQAQLLMSAGEISNVAASIEFSGCYAPIIENIISLGLNMKAESIKNKLGKE